MAGLEINQTQAGLLKDIFADGKVSEEERDSAVNNNISEELINELSGKAPYEVNDYVDKLLSDPQNPYKKKFMLGGAALGGLLTGMRQGIKHGFRFGVIGAIAGAAIGALIGWGISKFFKKEEVENSAPQSKMKVTDATVHTLKSGETMAVVASQHNVSLSRVRKINNVKDERRMQIGDSVKIPERYHIDGVTVEANFNDVSNCTQVSKYYMNDICNGLECGNKGPATKAYYDNVPDETHPKGYLTIGFGHTGYVDGKRITESTTITKEKAYELLAQDLLAAKSEAITFLGKEEYLRAPQSIQDAILDVAYNKDSEKVFDGIERNKDGTVKGKFKSETVKLKEDLANNDYVSAAKHVIYNTKNTGLMKRNVYRVIVATKDLSQSERLEVLNAIEPYYEKTKALLKRSESRILTNAWENAKKGICTGFFN